MSNEFLPKDYALPKAQNKYFKFKDGSNTVRILSNTIMGYEYWNTENKPVRTRTRLMETPKDIRVESDGLPSSVKHFWAFVVYNYDDDCVQIMEITQVSIMKQLLALVENSKWGDPKNYDVTISKSGEKLETRYTVIPNPHSELSPEIKSEYANTELSLDALFDGEDPFEAKIENNKINLDQIPF